MPPRLDGQATHVQRHLLGWIADQRDSALPERFVKVARVGVVEHPMALEALQTGEDCA